MMKLLELDDLQANGRRRKQYRKACEIRAAHPDAVIIEIDDEWTGKRFGETDKRRGQTIKIGHTTYVSQTWVSWAACDIEFSRQVIAEANRRYYSSTS